ncbi:MAG: DUF4433 domain-containing protein [Candidatus Njordarchaeales archaeon]
MGEINYSDKLAPVCDACWEKCYEGVRYLPAETRKKLKKVMNRLVYLYSFFKEQAITLEKERDQLITNIKMMRKSMLEAICRFLGISYLYYLTDWKNLESILKHGILCYDSVRSQNIEHYSFADENIQNRRANKKINGGAAHEFVPLFFHYKPPMLYRLQKSYASEIVYICVDSLILAEEGVFFTDKNLACSDSRTFDKLEELLKLKWDIIKDPYRRSLEDRHIRGAEVLIPKKVEQKWFRKIVVKDKNAKIKIQSAISVTMPIEVNSEYYFDI